MPNRMRSGVPDELRDGRLFVTTTRIPIQTVCMSDSLQCNAGCTYCPSRGMCAKERLPLRDLERVVDFFVAHTNRLQHKPRELSFVLNTLGEPSLGMDNVIALGDYVAHINDTGGCAVPLYFFMSSTNLLGVPDALLKYVNRFGYVTVSLHSGPVAEYGARIERFDGRVTTEGTDVIPKQPINLYARYREILEHFDLASMRPVREREMTMANSALWVEEFFGFVRTLDALSDAELAAFLPRLSFNDTLLNALKLLDTGAKLRYRCAAGIFSLQVTPDLEFYPCMFTQYPDLCMGDIECGLDPDWHCRFRARQRAGATEECASCEFLGACGGSCLDWARKDPSSDGFFSLAECAYRRGMFTASAEFLSRIEKRPPVIEALRRHLDLRNAEWRPKSKGR